MEKIKAHWGWQHSVKPTPVWALYKQVSTAGQQSSSMDRAHQCLRAHLRAPAWLLLWRFPVWPGKEKKCTPSFCPGPAVPLLPELMHTEASEKPGCATRQKHQHFPLELPLVTQTLQNHWSSCCTCCGATLQGHAAYGRACSSWLDFCKCVSKAETALSQPLETSMNHTHNIVLVPPNFTEANSS